MIEFNPFDHYWTVGDATTDADVYSSKRNIMVAVDDADYVAWSTAMQPPDPATGYVAPLHVTGHAADIDALRPALTEVLPEWLLVVKPSFIQPSEGVYDKPQLKGYSADRRWREEVSGIIVEGQSVKTDRVSQTMTAAVRDYLVSNPGVTEVDYKLADGTFYTVTETWANANASAISTHVQACFTKEKDVAAQIDASTITTLAQIDAAYDALVAREGRVPFEKLQRWQTTR